MPKKRTERSGEPDSSAVSGTTSRDEVRFPTAVPPSEATSRQESGFSDELASVQQRLQEAEEILRAIQNDEIDALAIHGRSGPQIYTLDGAEHPYRVLVETINEGAMTLAADGKILYCNPALARLLDAKQQPLVGEDMRRFVKPRDAQLFEALLERGTQDGSKGEVELLVHGRLVPVMLSFSALAIKGLRCACLIVTDLREQKRNEEILASERLNNSILEQAAEAIVVCDEEACITRANQQARILCGRNPLLANFDEIFPLVRASSASGAVNSSANGTGDASAEKPSDFSVRDVLAGKNFVGQELLFTRPREQQTSHLLISAGALRSGDGTVIGCVVTLSDITQRKEIERTQAELLLREQQAHADAQAANQAKDIFLATLSHELRTPLSAILGWVRLLRTPPNPKIAQKAIDVIERNARMQAQLIDDILDISRIISGKIALEPRVLNLFPVVIAAIESVRLAAEAKGIRINPTTSADSDLVMGDAARLQQVVWNLLSNATKFTPTGGSIDIALTADNRNLYVSVTDSGQGIEKDFLPFVFDRFRQADGTNARRHGGLGLGLAIVRHLVEMHGGLVTVASPGPDQGSTFTVQLPRSAKPVSKSGESLAVDRSQSQSEAAASLLGGLHLLLVDDQADTLEFLAMALQQQGARVSTASSAEAALMILGQPDAAPDVLISDIAMPGGDGYHLIHELRTREASHKEKPRIPAIALTAFARATDAEDALHAGFQKHISKPVDIAALASAVAALANKPIP